MSNRKDDGRALLRRWFRQKVHTPALAQFREALNHEILTTERLRIKAVIATVSTLVAIATALHFGAPSVFARITRGQAEITSLYAVFIPFLLFELTVLYLLSRRLADHGTCR